MEKRGGALMAHGSEALRERMTAYFDPQIKLENLANWHRGLMSPAAGFDPETARLRLQTDEGFQEQNLMRYLIRPFDARWCYFTAVNPIWNRSRPQLRAQLWEGNAFLVSRLRPSKSDEGAPMWFASTLFDDHALSPDAYGIPFRLRREIIGELEIGADGTMQTVTRTETVANYSVRARSYLAQLGFGSPDADAQTAALLWHHALAVGYAPLYRAQHAGGLASDWPRVPLPNNAETLRASAALGARVAALLDVATPFVGIETGKFDKGLEPFGEMNHRAGTPIEEGDASLQVTENWGYPAARGIVQPGGGKITTHAPDNREVEALKALGCAPDTPVCDIWASENLSWSGVPLPVWEMVIGGYPVIKKWLSYRDHRVLGRALHLSEAREVENMVRRLTKLWAMESALDASYENCASACWAWEEASED